MEDLLQNIIKDAAGKQNQNLKQAAQIAYDKLYRQHGMHRDPSYELRSVCFIALKMALDSKRSNLITLGLNGMHRLIRDERFFIGLEPEDDFSWLPAQLLRSTNGISCTSSEETIVNVLRLFLSMACSSNATLNGRLLIEVLSRCGEFWEYGTRSIKAASLAAASQCLRTFCSFLKDEAEELKLTAPTGANLIATATIYNEVIPVMQWLCSKLIEPGTNSTPKKQHSSLFFIESILTLTSSLPSDVHSSPHFTAFLWKTFCPNLAASLGSPGRVNIDKKFSYKDAIHMIESENRGFFTRPGLDGSESRCVYLTAIQLLRIAGAQGSLRPVLEALFHRMLLLPLPQNRSEPLRCVRDAFKSPPRLIDLSVILHYDKNQSVSDDMELFRLIIDSMEECAISANSAFGSDDSLHSSIECLVALLSSLQTLCTGNVENIINDQVADVINSRYSHLKDADYHGPLTYQSLVRLPRDYRDAVAELKHGRFEPADSDTEDNNAQNGNQEIDRVSNGSGETEGPEDDGESSDEQSKAEANWLYSHFNEAKIDGETDRKHAKEFARIVQSQLVPKLLKLHSSIEIDSEIQEFSSNICHQNSMNFSDFDYNLTAINADGIYLATYSTFLLSLQLIRVGHYDKTNGQITIPLSEQQFVTSVQNAGILVYLSSAWLRELYQCILASNPLENLDTIDLASNRCTLIDMICDAGGIGINSQMMSEWQRLQSVSNYNNQIEVESEKQKAAKKLARRLLTCCWDSMVVILSAGLGEIEDSRAKKLMKFSKKHLNVGNANRKHQGEAALYALSLEGLHAAATLSNCLQLQHLAGKILNMIATNVCQSSGPKLPSSQALSMELVLTGGLELGSCSEDCWLPVFSVCRHVTQLEHDLFSSSNSVSAGTNISNGNGKNDDSPAKDKNNPANYFIDEDETCVDVYSFLQAPLQSPNNNIATILKAYPNTVTLTQADTAKVLCALSHLADNLFNDAAERLNLPSLCQFLKSLCRASREQLYRSTTNKKGKKTWWLGRPWKVKNQSLPLSLLLHRVGEITLKIFRSSRPLLHILKVWSLSGPHLMDAACHKDRDISKRAIEYIHDIITALLVEQTELPHFHFNEALLKPFENILNMQNCDTDVQDQIITCCMEIVEVHRTEIRSGWRPLFGTMTTKKLHISSVIIDIFRIFLETESTLVFANAGLDCILCLLSYLETSSGSYTDEEGNEAATTPITSKLSGTEFLHDVLKFLERCSTILGCLYNMPNTPNLHSTYKIKGITYTHIVDANTQNSMENFQYFGNDHLQNANDQYMISYRSLHIDKDSITKLEELEKSNCGVLKVWFLLIDGLTNALILCPLSHQSPIIQTIFKIFRSIFDNPGLDFGFYCVNHLLIPLNQDWLRYINKTQKNWATIEKNFKHCCCMTTDLVVEFIDKSQYHQSKTSKKKPSGTKSEEGTDEASKIPTAANLALKQMLIVLIECSIQPQEAISRIGVSCLKHIIFSIGHLLNESQWLTICSAIHRASTINLAPIRQLSLAFYENSNSFYGDFSTLKVAARRDCTLEDINRVYSLSQQVFQLDNQNNNQRGDGTNKSSSEIKIINEDRSYSFLLYSNMSADANFVLRIPYRNLVIGLLASQMLLQLIANILLGGLKCVPSELHSVIYEYNATNSNEKKPQFNLSYRAKEILYRCLRQYFNCSIEFDYRPGLKFLIQKVSSLDYAANLYKQLTSSFIIIFMSLVDVYLNDIEKLNLSSSDIRYIIESCTSGDGLIKKKEFFVRNMYLLREIWNQVSELYLKEVKISPTSCPPTSTLKVRRESFANEINIVENKMVEIQEQLENGLSNYDTDDDVFLPPPSLSVSSELGSGSGSGEGKIEKAPSEESVKIFLKEQQGQEDCNSTNPFLSSPTQTQRENPFNRNMNENKQQVVSPEIEQQRKLSILKDEQCKRRSLTQLIVASMELLKLLPNESTENIRLLFMNTRINEAFELVEGQENNLESYKYN